MLTSKGSFFISYQRRLTTSLSLFRTCLFTKAIPVLTNIPTVNQKKMKIRPYLQLSEWNNEYNNNGYVISSACNNPSTKRPFILFLIPPHSENEIFTSGSTYRKYESCPPCGTPTLALQQNRYLSPE